MTNTLARRWRLSTKAEPSWGALEPPLRPEGVAIACVMPPPAVRHSSRCRSSKRIYVDVPEYLHADAANSVRSHLKKLRNEGRVVGHDSRWSLN